jgi:hypothetical protein
MHAATTITFFTALISISNLLKDFLDLRMPVHAFVCNADNPTDQIYRLSSPFGDAVAFLLDFHGPWLEMRRSEVELELVRQTSVFKRMQQNAAVDGDRWRIGQK